MIEVTIYQKDTHTHTKFILHKNGSVFGKENFALAKGWRDQGLLGEKAAGLIDAIINKQAAHSVISGIGREFQIEI